MLLCHWAQVPPPGPHTAPNQCRSPALGSVSDAGLRVSTGLQLRPPDRAIGRRRPTTVLETVRRGAKAELVRSKPMLQDDRLWRQCERTGMKGITPGLTVSPWTNISGLSFMCFSCGVDRVRCGECWEGCFTPHREVGMTGKRKGSDSVDLEEGN